MPSIVSPIASITGALEVAVGNGYVCARTSTSVVCSGASAPSLTGFTGFTDLAEIEAGPSGTLCARRAANLLTDETSCQGIRANGEGESRVLRLGVSRSQRASALLADGPMKSPRAAARRAPRPR